MTFKELARIIADVLFTRPKRRCSHCGGVHCMGICGAASSSGTESQNKAPKPGSDPATDPPA